MTPQDITSATSVHYTTATATTTAKTKTSKLINSETKVEHARKINIKKVAKELRELHLYFYLLCMNGILAKLLLVFFAVIVVYALVLATVLVLFPPATVFDSHWFLDIRRGVVLIY